MTIREQLIGLAEPRYRQFTSALMPGVEHVIGVRLPLLRRMAREVIRGDWRGWLSQAEEFYFEERMLQGMVVSCARCEAAEKMEYAARFVPKIDNWAVCDSFCWKLKPGEREAMWRFIQPYFDAKEEYGVRFATVMALSNFVDREHLEELLAQLGRVRHEGYYARMGVAWAVSVCYAKFPERTHAWLAQNCPLCDWTFNKSLQKIADSYRVDASAKRELRELRRKAEKGVAKRSFAK